MVLKVGGHAFTTRRDVSLSGPRGHRLFFIDREPVTRAVFAERLLAAWPELAEVLDGAVVYRGAGLDVSGNVVQKEY